MAKLEALEKAAERRPTARERRFPNSAKPEISADMHQRAAKLKEKLHVS